MSRIRLYIDEDAMQRALIGALRARQIDVVTAAECGMVNRSDEEHLRYASGRGRTLFSFNISDFAALHSDWMPGGEPHAGLILAPQQRYSVGDQLRRLLRLINQKSDVSMKSNVEYLSNWEA